MKLNQHQQDIAKQIKAAIVAVDPAAQVILFGSQARGQQTPQSDWDVLVLTDEAMKPRQKASKYINATYYLELKTGEAISPLIISKQDWQTQYAVSPLYNEVVREGIVL